MRIAYCMFGQPRHYKEGYEYLTKFMNINPNHTFDIFFHTWTLKPGQTYTANKYRDIPSSELQYKENIIELLKECYKPKDCCWELSIDKFDENIYINSLAIQDRRWNARAMSGMHNLISQYYSKYKVRTLLKNYIERTGENYDMVILTRFDYLNDITINLDIVDKTKVYAGLLDPDDNRKYITNIWSMSPTDVFLKWFDIWPNMEAVINNPDLKRRIESYGEGYTMNGEELMLMHYLYHYPDISNVVYTRDIRQVHKDLKHI